jgi:hypothetical protein
MKAFDLLFGFLGYIIKLVSQQLFYFADCPNDVPDLIEPDCQAFESGRIVALAFIDEDHTFTDITDPVEWTTVTTVEGKGAQAEKSVGRDHTMNVRIRGIKGNDAHFNSLNRATNYKVAFVSGKDYDILYYVDALVDINVGIEILSALSSEVDWVGTITWSDNDLPSTSDVPVGIFN